MHRHTPSLLLLAVACSSGSSTVVPPPPPPAPVAASLTVLAGDNQTAEPGAKVAVRPAVLVKDASGAPVSGVSVVFAVDSGNGSIASPSVTTGADGNATAGDWTLGGTEGRNVLRATIPAVPTIPPVRFAATAQSATQNLGGGTLPVTGGSFTVTKPGSAINGMRFDVAADAFTTPITLTISTASNAGVPRREGVVNPLTPVITIASSSGEFGRRPVKVHIPVAIPDGTFPVMVRYNASTGEMDPLTTIAYDATGLTVLFWNFNGGNTLSATTGAGIRGGTTVSGFVSAISNATLMADYDTGFRPGANGWEFPVTATVLGGTSLGMEVSSLWYFAAPPAVRPSLYKHFQLADGVPLSDRQGLRWSATISRNLETSTVTYSLARAMLDLNPTGADLTWDENTFRNVRAHLSFGLPGRITPQLLVIGQSNTQTFEAWMVWRAVGRELSVYDPYKPGDNARVVTFPVGQHMTPYSDGVIGQDKALDAAMSIGFGDLVDIGEINTQYAKVLNGTIGNDGPYPWPTYARMVAWGSAAGQSAPAGDLLYVLDPNHPLLSYIDCVTCGGNQRSTRLPPGPPLTGGIGRYTQGADGKWSLLDSRIDEEQEEGLASPGTRVEGAVVTGFAPSGPDFNNIGGWMDWVSYTVKRVPATLDPPSLEVSLGSPLSGFLFQSPEMPPTANAEWQWTQNGVEKNVTTDPVTPAFFIDGGPYTIDAIMRDRTSKQPIALAEAMVSPAPRPAWIFTSFMPSGPFDAHVGACLPLTQLQAHPGDGALVVHLTGQLGIASYTGMALEWTKTAGTGITVPFVFDPTLVNYTDVTINPTHTFLGSPTGGSIAGLAGCGGYQTTVSAIVSPTTISGTIFVKNIVTNTDIGTIVFQANRVVP